MRRLGTHPSRPLRMGHLMAIVAFAAIGTEPDQIAMAHEAGEPTYDTPTYDLGLELADFERIFGDSTPKEPNLEQFCHDFPRSSRFLGHPAGDFEEYEDPWDRDTGTADGIPHHEYRMLSEAEIAAANMNWPVPASLEVTPDPLPHSEPMLARGMYASRGELQLKRAGSCRSNKTYRAFIGKAVRAHKRELNLALRQV